jgi:hypothetical protein
VAVLCGNLNPPPAHGSSPACPDFHSELALRGVVARWTRITFDFPGENRRCSIFRSCFSGTASMDPTQPNNQNGLIFLGRWKVAAA